MLRLGIGLEVIRIGGDESRNAGTCICLDARLYIGCFTLAVGGRQAADEWAQRLQDFVAPSSIVECRYCRLGLATQCEKGDLTHAVWRAWRARVVAFHYASKIPALLDPIGRGLAPRSNVQVVW